MTHDSVQTSWSRLMRWRSECWQRFGGVPDMPIRTPQEELQGLLAPGRSVLDIGAGAHKPFQSLVLQAEAKYSSLDTDPEGSFDFRSFEEIPPDLRFDLVLANQVLEHMSVDQAFTSVCSAHNVLVDGGTILATVPNAAHPVRQWDCTHITPWPANDLYSLLRSAGFQLTAMARYSKFRLTANPLKRWVIRTVCREFRIDWCDSILAVGLKQP